MRYTRLGRGRLGVMLVVMLVASLFAPISAFAAPAQSSFLSRGGNTEWVQVYTVQVGDTLSKIALRFGVSEEALMQANSLRNPDRIYVGQQLIIPEKSSGGGNQGGGSGGPQCADYHTVRRGETLSGIALWYGVDAYALARANGIYDLNDIYSGQKLCIPGSGGNSGGSTGQPPAQGGCGNNPCGQPQEPQRPVEQPQRPVERPVEPQRPAEQPSACNPCGQQGGQQGGQPQVGPQNPGSQNQGPQRPTQPQYPGTGGPCGSNPCSGPQNPGPQNPGPQRPGDGGLRPTEAWKGMYFNDKYFGEFVLERQDLEINFNWFTGSPFSDMEQDRFSVRWEKVEYFKGGPYRFYAIADDGVRVYVDDQLIIDQWRIQPATEFTADLNLSEGPHKIVVEYYEEAENAQIRVYWEPRHQAK